jgi:dihydrofolate reductase
MSKVIADISMSLDGHVTARGVDQEHGLGIGAEAVLAHSFEKTGAVVMGRRLYDIVDGQDVVVVRRQVS